MAFAHNFQWLLIARSITGRFFKKIVVFCLVSIVRARIFSFQVSLNTHSRCPMQCSLHTLQCVTVTESWAILLLHHLQDSFLDLHWEDGFTTCGASRSYAIFVDPVSYWYSVSWIRFNFFWQNMKARELFYVLRSKIQKCTLDYKEPLSWFM